MFQNRYFLRMTLFTVSIFALMVVLNEPLRRIFLHNVTLNSLIFSVLFFGGAYVFYRMWQLQNERTWLLAFEKGEDRLPGKPQTMLLKPLAIALRDPAFQGSLSPLSARSVLVSIQDRLDETRDISRYIVGLLVFLGLLGTFWGLSQTIGAIAGVIGGLDISGAKVEGAFATMKEGLQSPLSGMGTAFSCSMFGLAGSLIVGFLDLQYGKALGGFYHMVEERLGLITRFGGNGDMANSGPAYSQGLLEQTIEGMGALHSLMHRHEENRVSTLKTVQTLADKLANMSEQMLTHQNIMKKIAQNQIDIQDHLMQYLKNNHVQEQNDQMAKTLRSLDATTLKMLEELVEGRTQNTQELKTEIRLIARTLSAIASGQELAA